MMIQSSVIFDFNHIVGVSSWSIVDDDVMGGRSSGRCYLNEDGNGIFEGEISLKNNGGFSSVRYRFDKLSTQSYSKIVLRVKGDGKKYQFRIKHRSTDYYSYISYFQSASEWKIIEIPLADMYPAFRGRTLDISNFQADSIEEIAFLIGNKKAESFKLEIDRIVLK